MSENEVEAFLLSVGSSMEADVIESLLKANDIPVLRKYRESGGYMMIMMGSTIYGVDLYVPGDMLDKAREIVDNSREASKDAAFPANVKPDDMTGEAPEDEDATEECAVEDGAEKFDGTEEDAVKGTSRSISEDTAEDTAKDAEGDAAGSEAGNGKAGDTDAGDTDAGDTDAGDTDAGDTEAGNANHGNNSVRDTDAGEVNAHEEQYRLAEEHSERKRRSRAWMTLLFFTLLILIITMLVKYLYGLFAVK